MGNTDFRMERHTMIFRRRFRATREEMYAAWTDAAQLAQWSGPEVAYPLTGVYADAIPNERLVFAMDMSERPDTWHARLDALRDTPTGARGGDIVTTVTFEDAGEETVMTVSQRFDEASDRDAHYHLGTPKAWGEGFDRLERLLSR